jgi:hypothetical protein
VAVKTVLAMHFITVLAALLVTKVSTAELHKQEGSEQPAFGIEFSMENILISFAPPGGHARGLASVKGNEAYRDLLYSHFELC